MRLAVKLHRAVIFEQRGFQQFAGHAVKLRFYAEIAVFRNPIFNLIVGDFFRFAFQIHDVALHAVHRLAAENFGLIVFGVICRGDVRVRGVAHQFLARRNADRLAQARLDEPHIILFHQHFLAFHGLRLKEKRDGIVVLRLDGQCHVIGFIFVERLQRDCPFEAAGVAPRRVSLL